MPLLPCKCPNCGAQLEVDKSNEAAVCKYCNTPFIVEKAINNYNINNNFAGANIIMEDGVSLENLYTLARRALEAEKYEDASNYYHDILKRAPNDWEAVFFINYCKAATYKYSEFIDIARDFANGITEAGNLIKLITDENEQHNAIKTLSSFSLKCFSYLYKNLIPSDDSHIDEFKGFALATIGYNLGNSIENINIIDESINNIKLEVWKKSIAIEGRIFFSRISHIEYNIAIEKKLDHNERIDFRAKLEESEVKRINVYINKVKQYDPNYIPPILKCLDYGRNNNSNDEKNAKSGGCYIATCVYGAYDCPEVWTLRRFRDYCLDNSWYGRLFIKCYYAISPQLVKNFGNKKWFKEIGRKKLDKLIVYLNKQGYSNTSYNDKY